MAALKRCYIDRIRTDGACKYQDLQDKPVAAEEVGSAKMGATAATRKRMATCITKRERRGERGEGRKEEGRGGKKGGKRKEGNGIHEELWRARSRRLLTVPNHEG